MVGQTMDLHEDRHTTVAVSSRPNTNIVEGEDRIDDHKKEHEGSPSDPYLPS